MPSFVRRSQVQEFDVKTDSNAMSSPTPPQNRPHKDTEDHRSGFAAISAKTPVDEAFRTAFLRNKLLIAHTHPGLEIRVREEAVAALVDRLGREAARDVITQPRPGGVGEGFFYNPDFKTSWGLGTSISGDFVCPAPPGGNVNTWLYLTATNRSGLGVEAFVSYDGQDTPHFRVFDWARTDSWQTDIPLHGAGELFDHNLGSWLFVSGASGVEQHLGDRCEPVPEPGAALQPRPRRLGLGLPV
jgi:hypothetical protein